MAAYDLRDALRGGRELPSREVQRAIEQLEFDAGTKRALLSSFADRAE